MAIAAPALYGTGTILSAKKDAIINMAYPEPRTFTNDNVCIARVTLHPTYYNSFF